MGMTIAERMAMQARAAVASHQAPMKSVTKSATVSAAQRMAKQATVTKAAPPAPKATPASGSAAQRIARQASIARQDSVSTAAVPPPPAATPAPSMSAAERIQKQAIAAIAQKNGDTKVEVNKDIIEKLKAQYKVFLKKLEAELAKEGPMYFVQKTESPEATPVNGVSTAEGEMVIEAKASEPVTGMPYQVTPVISTAETKPEPKKAPRQIRRRTKKTIG